MHPTADAADAIHEVPQVGTAAIAESHGPEQIARLITSFALRGAGVICVPGAAAVATTMSRSTADWANFMTSASDSCHEFG